jgi:PAS domain S-box-containing protein
MKRKRDISAGAADLRRRAEKEANSGLKETLSTAEMRRVSHELRVHQIELQMQNEELRRSQSELEDARDRYVDLYDSAPTGYFAISEKGVILEANLTFATMLGVARDMLIKQPFTRFIIKDDQDIFYKFRKELFKTGKSQACEARLLRAGAGPFWAQLKATLARDAGGNPVCRATAGDVTERMRAEDAVRKSEELYRVLFDQAADGVVLLSADGEGLIVNESFARMHGYAQKEMEHLRLRDLDTPESAKLAPERMRRLLAGETLNFEVEHYHRDGHSFPLSVNCGVINVEGRPHFLGFHRDVTEYRQADNRERLMRDVLDRLNRIDNIEDATHDILLLVKRSTGIEAVGIRLRVGDDFPYYETNGFPESFVRAERYLCERDKAGDVVRDAQGRPVLECMCGNIIRGRFDPKLPFFTEGGSFWTNGTTKLLASTTEKERQSRTRNRCNKEGYESVALVPLRSGDDAIGLLQLNDHRPGRFTPEMIRFFEGLAAGICIAFLRKRAVEKLGRERERLETLTHGLGVGVAVISRDYKTIWANAVLKQTFGDVEGKKCHLTYNQSADVCRNCGVRDIFEGGRDSVTHEQMGKDKDGKTIWSQIIATALRDEHGNVTVASEVIVPITERKRSEEVLQQERDFARSLIDTAQAIVLVLDPRGRISHFNPYMEEISGYRVAEVRGCDWFSTFLRRGDRSRIRALFRKAIGDIQTRGNCNAIVAKDGREIMIEWCDKTLKGPDGKVTGLLAIGQDITERKRAEVQLVAEKTKLRALATQLSVVEEQERRRIAMHLHDGVAQGLSIGKMKLKELKRSVQALPGQAESIDEAIKCITDAIQTTRRLVMDLNPPILHELGLEIAIEWLCDQTCGHAGLEVRFASDGLPKPLEEHVRDFMFRAVRELLINVVKHAKARSVEVGIKRKAGTVCVTVKDDGVGMRKARLNGGADLDHGFGLFSVRERVEHLGGRFELKSAPKEGTMVVLIMPLAKGPM